MSVNQLIFGRAVTIDVISPITGQLITLAAVTSFDSKQMTVKENSKPLNAPPIKAHTPDGWSGNIEFDMLDDSIDAFFAEQDAAYWANSITFAGEIWETITLLNKSTVNYHYTGCAFTLQDAGKKTSQGKITQKVEFEASERRKIT